MASNDNRTARFEIGGKSVSKSEFETKVKSLTEIPGSRTSAKGEDEQGHNGFVVRYEAQDRAGAIWGVSRDFHFR